MKSFRQLVEEKTKSIVMAIGRMNPPTKGHEENVKGIQDLAKRNHADHIIVASHANDAKKNPLDVKTKMKHIKRAFPDANIVPATKEAPVYCIMQQKCTKKVTTMLSLHQVKVRKQTITY